VGPWGATWLLALSLAISLTWWFEHTTRAHGQRPSVVDDPVAWSLARRTVDGDRRVVAFVGTSRMALGYSPEAFAEAAPERRGIQLAINGSPALGVLEDLANDDQFRGIAVVDILEWDVGVFDAFTSAQPYVKRSHALWRAPGALVNRSIASLIQERLATLAVGGRQLIISLVGKHHWPAPTWTVSDRERTTRADYSLADPKDLQAKREWRVVDFFKAIPTADAWLATLERDVEPLVKRIRSHGGDVVIVHMPISGVFAQDFDQGFPRNQYWDVFAARTAAHVIHFRDIPSMATLACPDEMHLDQRDQATFTRGLVDALRDKGVFRDR
jgi:hypothetical protein